jgi:hypothetical protein
MADEQAKSLGDFGASFKGFLDQIAAQTPAEEPVLLGRLRDGPFRFHGKHRAHEVQKQVRTLSNFTGETVTINVEGPNSRFGRKFRWTRGSRIL